MTEDLQSPFFIYAHTQQYVQTEIPFLLRKPAPNHICMCKLKVCIFSMYNIYMYCIKAMLVNPRMMYNNNAICNVVTFYTTGFESFSVFILDCWSIINFIVNDDILDLRWLWLGSGARHSLCDAHLSSYMYFNQINIIVSSDHT